MEERMGCLMAVCILLLIGSVVFINIKSVTNKSIVGQSFTAEPDSIMDLPSGLYVGSVGDSALIEEHGPFPFCLKKGQGYYKEGVEYSFGRYSFRIDKIEPDGSITYTILSYYKIWGGGYIHEPQ